MEKKGRAPRPSRTLPKVLFPFVPKGCNAAPLVLSEPLAACYYTAPVAFIGPRPKVCSGSPGAGFSAPLTIGLGNPLYVAMQVSCNLRNLTEKRMT